MPRDVWLLALSFSAAALIIGTLRLAWYFRAKQAIQASVDIERKTPTKLHEVIDDVLRQLETPIALGLVHLDLTLQDGTARLPVPSILVDAFKSVLQRAVGRAAGGSVLISAERVGDRVQVTVADDGRPASPDGMMAELRQNAEALALQGGSLQVTRNLGRSGNVVVLQVMIAPAERPVSRPAWLRAPPAESSTTSQISC